MERKRNRKWQILALLALSVLSMFWYVGRIIRHAALNHELVQAVRDNDIARVKRALNAGARPDVSEAAFPLTTWQMLVDALLHRQPRNAIPVLLTSVNEGHHDISLLLLQRGANPNLIDPTGAPILMATIGSGDTGLAEALLQHGANPNIANLEGSTALMWAANRFGSELTEALLSHGADPNTANRAGQTPLMWAIGPVYPAPMRSAAGAMTGGFGSMTAVRNANLDVVKALLAHGASASAHDSVGNSVLAYAAEQSPNWGHGALPLAPLLIARGADVNGRLASNSFNFAVRCATIAASWSYGSGSPLHQPLLTEFVMKGDIVTVRQMLAHGADVRARDNQGHTALFYAKDPQIKTLLIRAGAKN